MTVMSGQAKATDKPETAVTGQGKRNVMLMGKGVHSPIRLLHQTNNTSSAAHPYKYTFYMSRCELGLAVNLT